MSLFPAEIWCHICSYLHYQDVWDVAFFFPYLQVQDKYDTAFRKGCLQGKLTFVKWLTQAFQRLDKDARDYYNRVFGDTALHGQLHILQWLTQAFHLGHSDVVWYQNMAFRNAAKGGHVSVMQWLVQRFQLTRKDIYCFGYEAFYQAAQRGDLVTLEWLTHHFPPESSHVVHAFGEALTFSQIPVLNWILASFTLPKDILQRRKGLALRRCCRKGNLEGVQWLVYTFKLPEAVLKEKGFSDIMRGTEDVHIMQWLIQHFQLDARSVRNRLDVNSLAKWGYLDTLKWMHEVESLDKEVKEYSYDAFQSAVSKGRLEVLEWMINTFHIDAAIYSSICHKYKIRKAHSDVKDWLSVRLQ